jgi:hypothetical protein
MTSEWKKKDLIEATHDPLVEKFRIGIDKKVILWNIKSSAQQRYAKHK